MVHIKKRLHDSNNNNIDNNKHILQARQMQPVKCVCKNALSTNRQ